MATNFNVGDSAVNTAILSSIFDLTNAQKVLAGAIFGFTKKFNLVDTDSNKNQVDKDTKESIKLLNETATNISKRMAELEAENRKIEKNKKNSILEHLADISEVFGNDEKKSKRFNDTIKNFDKFLANANRSSEARALFTSLTELSESIFKFNLTNTGKGLLAIAGGLTAIGLSVFMISKAVTFTGIVATTAVLGVVLGFAYSITKLDQSRLDTATTSMIRLSSTMLIMAGSVALLSIIPLEGAIKGIAVFTALTATIVATNLVLNKFGTTRMNGMFASAGPALIASSLGVLGIGIWTFNALVPDPRSAMMPILVISGFALALAVINMIPGKGGVEGASKGLLYASASIAVLAASIMVWDALSPQQVVRPVLAVVGLALGLALMNKIAGGDMKQSAIGLIIASVSVAVLAGAIYVWDYLGIDEDMIALPALAIVGLMGGLALITKVGGQQILMASASLIVAGIAVGILAFSVNMWKDIDEDTMTKTGLFVGGVALGLMGLAGTGSMALVGALALVIAGGAIWLIGKGLNEMKGMTGEQLLNAGLFVTGIGTVITLLGLAPWSILGAVALGLAGGALYIIGKGMIQMSKADWSKSDVMMDGIARMAEIFKDIGGPIDTPLILSGALSVLAIGRSTLAVAQTLKTLSDAKLTNEQITGSANSIGLFIQSMLNVFDNFDGSYFKVRKGIWALSSLGNMISSLANGLVQMGKLTFVEYGVVDGKLVPVSSRKFTDADFNNVGTGIARIIDALTVPLAKVGADAGIFTSGNVGRGIKSLTGLGNLVKGIADGVTGIANLQFTEYAIVDGKLVPVSTTKFDANQAQRVGTNIGILIDALVSPLSKIGKGSSWAKDADVKNGIDALEDLAKNVINPLKSMVDFIKNANLNEQTATQQANVFNILLNGITQGLKTIEDSDFDEASEGMEDFVKQVKDLTSYNPQLNRTRSNFERINRSLANINGELTNDKLKRILELRDAINDLSSQKLYDNMSAVITLLEQKLAPLIMSMNGLLEQNNMYMMGQGGGMMGGATYDPNNPLMGGTGAMLQNGNSYQNMTQPFSATPPATAEDIQALGEDIKQSIMQLIMQNKKK